MSEKTFGPDASWFYRPTMDVGDDYPKWVEAHADHVVMVESYHRRISPAFSSSFETHEGKFLVLVLNEDEERMAVSPKETPEETTEETEDE